MSLQDTLACTAERIAVYGTQSERIVLEAVAAAAGSVCPGAAAALVDWNGPEITRLRAYAIVHGALLRDNALLGARQVVCRSDPVSAGRAA